MNTSTPRLVAFADLDDTLFQTLRKRNVADMVVAGIGPDGKPLSYACPKQQKLLQALMHQGVVIPTTARNFESFSRVQLEFKSYVILNFGASLLNPDRTLNEAWHENMAQQAQAARPMLLEQFEAAKELDSRKNLGLNIRLVGDFGEDWYVLVKHKGHDEAAMDALEQQWIDAALPGFIVRRNDNNLTLSPDFFDKKHAVKDVIARFFNAERDVFLGLGDSLSDFDFMSACDYLVMPSQSQLHGAYKGVFA
jgi:hypothetical protein